MNTGVREIEHEIKFFSDCETDRNAIFSLLARRENRQLLLLGSSGEFGELPRDDIERTFIFGIGHARILKDAVKPGPRSQAKWLQSLSKAQKGRQR